MKENIVGCYQSPSVKVIEIEIRTELLGGSPNPNVTPGWKGGSDGDDDNS